MDIRENVRLADYTTFELGGPARHFVEVKTKSDLLDAINFAEENHLKFLVLGGGSNVLISDAGFDGIVIKIFLDKFSVLQNGEVEIGAGHKLATAIKKTSELGLSGWESMYGIPGTLGGSVRGNAGAFGTEIKDVATRVNALNISTREERLFSQVECTFGYRKSFFKENPNWVILSVIVTLKDDVVENCISRIENTFSERVKRQVQNIRSAGSFFLNPVVSDELREIFEKEKNTVSRAGRVPAGWLIDRAGFKGLKINGVLSGAQSSNYILQDGSATAKAVVEFANKIKNGVFEKFGVKLESEVLLLGEF